MSCVTLLSDFGLLDGQVACAKGILMQYAPKLPVVDISHMVEPYHMQQASYILASSFRCFPKGTIHVVLFDVFHGSSHRLLLCEHEGHFFLSPDNGILAMSFVSMDAVWECHVVAEPPSVHKWFHEVGKMIKKLQTTPVKDLKLEAATLKIAPANWCPKINEDYIEGQVMHIDRFENAIINITREQFDEVRKDRPFVIRFQRKEEIRKLSNHYSDVPFGEKLCRFNSAGFLEIALNRGSTVVSFGLKMRGEHQLLNTTITVYFSDDY